MAKPNRKCFFFFIEYHYCSTCPNDIKKPSWYAMWCEQCKALDNIVAAHRTGKITTEEAKNKINELNIDVNSLKFAREPLKEYFNNIMSYGSENISEIKNVDEINVKNTKNIETVDNIENVKDNVNIESIKSKKIRTRKTKIVSKSKIKENKEENK